MRAGVIIAVIGALAVLPGCNRLSRAPQATAVLPYKTSLAKGEDPRDMLITVEANGATLAQVRESVRFEATRHCLTTRGRSDTDWDIDPGTGDWGFMSAGTALVFRARCRA